VWWLFAAVAAAHPYDTLYFGHLVQLRVHEDRVLVGYTAEIPAGYVRRERLDWERSGKAPDAWLAAKQAELRSGLDVRIDGVTVPVTAEVVEVKEDTRFLEVQLVLEAPLADGPHRIEVGNANYPEELSFHRAEAWVARPWTVTATSLVEPAGGDAGPAGRVHHGKWRNEESARRLVVDVAPRAGLDAIAQRFEAGDGWRTADEALTASPLGSLSDGWMPLLAGLVALAFGWWWTRGKGPARARPAGHRP
jgi:hypothetical protein